MSENKPIRNFKATTAYGYTLLTAQEHPWSVLQVVPTTPDNFDEVFEKLKKRGGYVAIDEPNRTFCIIHLCSGDQGGKYPERHIVINNVEKYFAELRDTMAQGVAWYRKNIQEPNITDLPEEDTSLKTFK